MSKPWTFTSIAPVEAPLPTDAVVGPRIGRWKKGLFECFSNCGMCVCVCCCTTCTIGQVASIARKGAGWMCLLITLGILFLNAGATGLEYYYANWVARWTAAIFDSERDAIGEPQAWMITIASTLSFFASLVACLCVWNARAKYRARDGIAPECGMFSDCLAAWCCSPCSVCQMFSQDDIVFGGGAGRPYRMFWATYDAPLEPASKTATAV